MSYTILVRFSREFADDCPLVDGKPEYQGMTYKEALKQQFHEELQKAYDESGGDLAGLFEVMSIETTGLQNNKTLHELVGSEKDPMRAALARICWARDYNMEHGEYPKGTLGADQQFDDWAADVAEKALGPTKKFNGKRKKGK